MTPAPFDIAAAIAQMDAVRTRQPLVQCLTNSVTVGFVANVLLAAGATPAMVDSAGESEVFAREAADAVLVNLGTPHPAQCEGIRAIGFSAPSMPPWVLDPVAVGALPVRTELAHELVAAGPSVIRGNASEIAALAGTGTGGRGVDSVLGPDDVVDAARTLASRTGGAVAVSGEVDLVTDGETVVRIANGHPLFTAVTGGGCALGAVTAAYAAVAPSPLIGAAAAATVYAIAGEKAAARSAGPGSFAVELLDALHAQTPADIAQKAVIS